MDQQLQEARPAQVRELLRGLGFDPDSGNALALRDLIDKDPELVYHPSKVAALAQRYGWSPTMEPTETPTPTTPRGSLDDQIIEAEASGDWFRAGMLKVQKHEAGVQDVDTDPIEPERAERIRAAEQRGDYFASGLEKAQTMFKPGIPATAPIEADLAQQILDAARRGDYAESLRLKMQASR